MGRWLARDRRVSLLDMSVASEPVVGVETRCPRHLDMPTLGVCARCGSLLCIRCMTDGDGGVYCPACAAMLPQPAPPSLRVAAHVIDVGIFVPFLGASALASLRTCGGGFDYEMFAIASPIAVAPLLAFQLFSVIKHGQSWGKRALGLQVLMLDNSAVPLWRLLLLRNFIPLVLGVIPWVAILFRIADVAALYSEGNRAVHDRIAGTKVMRASPLPLSSPGGEGEPVVPGALT